MANNPLGQDSTVVDADERAYTCTQLSDAAQGLIDLNLQRAVELMQYI